MEITFKAFEYNADDSFSKVEYRMKGDTSSGWDIYRNDKHHLKLGPGYALLKTLACGICSTDIDRRFLPFDLPQVIGHEVIAQLMSTKERVAVEINDTPVARGEQNQDPFCREGIHTHSPGRLVLGIDRLPGGFAPYLLAPVNAIVPLKGLDDSSAVLIEPFAAALQAVKASPPQNGDEVAVLGPGRLGTLLIAALSAYRASTGFAFRIAAVAKYDKVLGLCRTLGADFGVNITTTDPSAFESRFDLVFDTTGAVSGFERALHLSAKQIHLKSTNGQPMSGLGNLTAFVVDELSLLSMSETGMDFKWPGEDRTNREVYFAPENASLRVGLSGMDVYTAPIGEAEQILKREPFLERLPRFDLAVAGSLGEIDGIIRPSREHENALVRPQGAILFKGDAKDNPLLEFINRGGQLRSSRCGDFKRAIGILKENPDIAFNLSHHLISHVFPASELPEAFNCAKRKESIKVVIRHL